MKATAMLSVTHRRSTLFGGPLRGSDRAARATAHPKVAISRALGPSQTHTLTRREGFCFWFNIQNMSTSLRLAEYIHHVSAYISNFSQVFVEENMLRVLELQQKTLRARTCRVFDDAVKKGQAPVPCRGVRSQHSRR